MIARRIAALKTSAPLALALLAMGHGAPVLAHEAAAPADAALAKGDEAKGLDLAEAAVERAPRDAAARAALGRAYLKEGRFTSAATALGDAVALGDTSGRSLLALALAQVGSGQPRDAVATLDKGATLIPAADLGLALALAGEGGRGTIILADAVHSGDHSEKLRANLAFAYALDGRWAEARNLVSTDLPADQVDARMTDWAQAARPEAARERVATLLGVTLKDDAGLPAKLALAPVAAPTPDTAAMPALAVAEPAVELPPVTEAAPVALASAAPMFHAVEPVAAPKPVRVKHVKLALAPKVGGHHAAQLGAFLSEQNAAKARSRALARDKSLAEGDVVVAKAVVGGRTFWRVSVAGLDAASANGKCAVIRKGGGDCFARLEESAAVTPKPGSGQALALAAPVKARRGQ